ncbi:hypothetical protein C8N40_103452 [Pontibacter mucosus]|uniref:Uncharacterized protein n=1 Tax=Pontibacter mucosus TaxID=1649266 RepID=A0A2T5YM30_9BACT|nr:hypothetical protein C8N40_103452 [Pontibacter mucosus]
MQPPVPHITLNLTRIAGAGMVSASHHMALCDKLNGYCLCFYTAPKDFS